MMQSANHLPQIQYGPLKCSALAVGERRPFLPLDSQGPLWNAVLFPSDALLNRLHSQNGGARKRDMSSKESGLSLSLLECLFSIIFQHPNYICIFFLKKHLCALERLPDLIGVEEER